MADDRVNARRRVGFMIRLAKRAPMDGAFVEVGVFRGKTARMLYILTERMGRRLYLYDTFEGHPYPFKRLKEPTDGIGCHVPKAKDMARLEHDLPGCSIIKGVFPQSAIEMQPIAFAHVDVDSYQSTRDTIDHLWPLMQDKGIMLFDDYGKHFGCRQAVDETFHIPERWVYSRIRRAVVIKGVADAHMFVKRWRIRA